MTEGNVKNQAGYDTDRVYAAIDLKSFYASVECVEHGFDPLDTNLVVADASRTEKTICLAVSPSLKSFGIPGRARLFEVVQKVKFANAERLGRTVRGRKPGTEVNSGFSGSSIFFSELNNDPGLEISYFVAPPRMKLYEEYSTKIFSIYMKYISPEDMHVYSIDEVFIDLTPYLNTYKMTPYELTMTMIRDVFSTTGITATAGIGTNMYLAKVAMDIVAKHVPADKDGVRIAEIDEKSYREKLWCHKPLTDFWRVGKGSAKRLAALGCHTMGDVARLSLQNEDYLYKAFGINAELLIDHAWGYEPARIKDIKSYRPETNSLSSGQVLSRPYTADEGRLIVMEMTDLLTLEMVRKGYVTKQLVLTVNYDRESLIAESSPSGKKMSYKVAKTGKPYTGETTSDRYGRTVPKYAHGTANLERYTSSTRKIVDAAAELYQKIINPDFVIRFVNVSVNGLIQRDEIPPEEPEQLDFFTDYETREKQKEKDRISEEKELKLQLAALDLKEKFGKNAILKGMNLQDGGTTVERNAQVGGHKA